jgi:drug/metabolite transporter (DMT)-like permease
METAPAGEFLAELQLIGSTIIFGLAFVGQRFAMRATDDPIGALTFNAIRFTCSMICLSIIRPFLKKYSPSTDINDKNAADQDFIHRNGGHYGLLFWCVITGGSNFFGSWLTQNSLVALSAGKAGFITGTYVILIPFAEWLLPALFGHPLQCLHQKIWIGAFLCVVGMYFISGCTSGASCLGGTEFFGEMFALGAVVFWAINIMSVGLAAHQVDSVDLLLGQIVVVVVMSIICGIIFEPENWTYPYLAMRKYFSVSLFVGVLNVTAYYFCILGQISVRPSRAAIIYSAGESVAACIFGYLLLGETLTDEELFGGVMMVIAACIAATAGLEVEDEEDLKNEYTEADTITDSVIVSPRVAGFGVFELRKSSSDRTYLRTMRVDVDGPSGIELTTGWPQYGSF